jgi:hypothetical protein
LPALANSLTQPLRKQRMVLTQERSDDQGSVEAAQGGNRCAEPMRLTGLRLIAEISLAQTMVDVLAAQPAHQLAQQIQLFDRAVDRAQRTDRGSAMVSLDVLQAIGDIFKCCVSRSLLFSDS